MRIDIEIVIISYARARTRNEIEFSHSTSLESLFKKIEFIEVLHPH